MRSLSMQHRQAVVAALCLSAALVPARAAADEDEAPWNRPTPHHALGVSLGLGIVAPTSADASGHGQGVVATGEYVFWPSSWFSPRLYAGLEVAPREHDCDRGVTPCDVSGEFGFAGAKGRLLAPIPWVAPYLELGLGAAAGHFSTRSGTSVDRVFDGVTYEVPFSLGLAMGSRRQFELGLQYLIHPEARQVGGGIGIGLRIPVG